MRPSGFGRVAAALFGLLVTSAMILVKVLPWIPGHFTWHEWVACGIWAGLGAAVRASRRCEQEEQPGLGAADAAG